MCINAEHVFTYTTPKHEYSTETPLGAICDCGAFYWDGEQAQPVGCPPPCDGCYSLPKAAGADWCMDCPWFIAWDAQNERTVYKRQPKKKNAVQLELLNYYLSRLEQVDTE